MIDVVPFDPEIHLSQARTVLERIWQSDPCYPPRNSTDGTSASLETWLTEAIALGSWVALVEGAVAGHILTTEAHGYLLRHLAGSGWSESMNADVAEIGKFFVDPLHQRLGIGSVLLATVVNYLLAAGRRPALAVLAPSAAARRLYSSRGMTDLGTFEGDDGINHVFVGSVP